MSGPLVSIVLVTRNGRETLPRVFDALAAQRDAPPFEVVAVDSGSTDGTVEFLRSRVDALAEVDAAVFNHGTTRNLGVERGRGELVVLLVQDAVPASDRWLAALTHPLLEDPTVAGTYARQVPRADASGLTRYYHAHWLAASFEPRVSRVAGRAAFEALPPLERYRVAVFDNVCSCIRRSVWRRFPFRPTPIAEDLVWAREVLLAGFGLAYVPEAVVEHSHERSVRYEFTRTRLVHEKLAELFDLALVPDGVHLCRAVATSTAVHLRVVGSWSPRAVARALGLAVAYPLGQYLGARRGRRARTDGGA